MSDMSRQQRRSFLELTESGWRNARLRRHHVWTRLVDRDELTELRKETREDWPDWMQVEERWNHQPELFLVYHFADDDGYKVTFTMGLFQREGRWYFACQL